MNIAQLCFENVERYGEYRMLYFEGLWQTNIEHSRRCGALAAVLDRRGIARGDRVLVMMQNSPDVFAAFQAIWRLGAVALPVTPQLDARDVRFLIEHSEARAAFTSPGLAPRVSEASEGMDSFEHLLVFGPSGAPRGEDIEAELAEAAPVMKAVERSDDDLALLLYTSGTTGRPKGVMSTHGNLAAIRDAARRMLRMPPYLPTLHALPLSHGFGVLMMEFAYEHGWVAVMLPRWDTERVFQAIHSHRIARLSAVPTMLRYMLDFAERAKYDTSSLERVWLGGAPLPEELRREFEAEFHCDVHNGYAQSEATGIATACWDGDRVRPGSAGRAVAGVEVQVLDAGDRPLPPGETGEICIRGPNLMPGYWKDPEATSRVIHGGWLHTEDLGWMDADGFLHVTGRKKDLIIKGGENITPREIEDALLRYPAVGEAAVVGVPDPVFGEDIWAAATLKPGAEATEDELRAHLRQHVAKFKVPTRIVFFAELPKNSIGKILKREIRTELARMRAAAGGSPSCKT